MTDKRMKELAKEKRIEKVKHVNKEIRMFDK